MPAGTAVAGQTATPPDAQPTAPAAPLIPFTAASFEHEERIFEDVFTPDETSYNVKVDDVPSYGFIRHVLIEVDMADGVLGAGALHPDWPFNMFERIALSDVNGSTICELDGYALYIANVLGGYGFNQDPKDVDFAGDINGKFYLRIPVELHHHDGLGAITNQNAASEYQLAIRCRPLSQMFSAVPDAAPEVTVKGWLEAWALPNEVDGLGRPQAQLPPMHGTSGYFSANEHSVIVGQNTIPWTRVGQMIRFVAMIARDEDGLRSDACFPDPFSLKFDGNDIVEQVSQRLHKIKLRERLNRVDPSNLDAGLFAFVYNHSDLNRSGDGLPTMWLPTVNSSRIEVKGVVAEKGSVQVVTHDVAPVEVVPTERYEAPNRTGGVLTARGR